TNGPTSQMVDGPPSAARFHFNAYHHPNRMQSLSLGSISPLERAPFPPPAPYGATGSAQHFQDYARVGELGSVSMAYGVGAGMAISMGLAADCSKQRKRRGNLPKETTDKLRSWFMAHLNHPYPTEDEKQDLMRQTGLQMSKSPRNIYIYI